MPRGWESWIRVVGQPAGYGVYTGLSDAYYLYADSESFALNYEVKENTGKIVQGRALLETARTLQGKEAGGAFTFQPRSNDILPFLAGHLQCYRSVLGGTGTYVFNPITGQPDWAGSLMTGGDPWAAAPGAGTGTYGDTPTDSFTIMIDQYFGGMRIGSNGRRFADCVVDQLEFSAAVGEELKLTPTLKSGSFALVSFTAANDDPPCGTGSYSTLGAFLYYQGTLKTCGTSIDVTSFKLTSSNNLEARKVVGKRDPTKFPYGRYQCSGELGMEYDDYVYIRDFLSEADGTFQAVFLGGLGGAQKLTIDCPLIRYGEPTVNVSDGESLITQTVPFVAFGRAANRRCPPLEVTVQTTDVRLGGSRFFPPASA